MERWHIGVLILVSGVSLVVSYLFHAFELGVAVSLIVIMSMLWFWARGDSQVEEIQEESDLMIERRGMFSHKPFPTKIPEKEEENERESKI